MSDDEQDEAQLLNEDEWAARFGWSANEGKVSNLLSVDDEDICMLLRRVGEQFVWSQQDRDNGGLEIVPGMTPCANGYYLTDRPRLTPDDERVVAIMPPIDNDEDDEPLGSPWDQPIHARSVSKSVAIGPIDPAQLAQWRATLAETVQDDEMNLLGFTVVQKPPVGDGPYVVWAHLELNLERHDL